MGFIEFSHNRSKINAGIRWNSIPESQKSIPKCPHRAPLGSQNPSKMLHFRELGPQRRKEGLKGGASSVPGWYFRSHFGHFWRPWPPWAPVFSRSFFRCFFPSFFDRFCPPKPSPNRAQIDEKSMPEPTSNSAPFFHVFFIRFLSETGRLEPRNH